MQTAIAAAASWRALAGSTLTGNHWSGARRYLHTWRRWSPGPTKHGQLPRHGAVDAVAGWSHRHRCARRARSEPAVCLARLSCAPSFCVAFAARCPAIPGPASGQALVAAVGRSRRIQPGGLLPRRALQATGVSYGGYRGPRADTVLTPGAGFHTKQALSVDAIQELLPGGRGRPAALARLKERDNGAHTAVVIVGLWDVQLHQDAAHVFFDGSFGDPKLPGDARI